jgi:hypothetical protein
MKNKIVQVADAGLPFYAFLANYSGSTIESEYSAVLENLNNPCRV